MNQDVLKKVKQIDFILKTKVEQLLHGQYRSAFKGQGVLFSDLREYVPGDDVRSLSWNLLAKTQNPYIKTFEEERENMIILAVDISSSFQFGTGEFLKQDVSALLSATLALCSQKNQDSIGLLLFSEDVDFYLTPRKGRTHTLRIVREIYSKKSHSSFTDLNPTCLFLQNVLKKRSHIFILSDFFFSKPCWHSLKKLSQKHQVAAISILDFLELQFPEIGLIDLEETESQKRVTVSSQSYFFQKEYKKTWQNLLKQQNKEFAKAGVDVISVDTSQDVFLPLIKFFNRNRRSK